MSMYEQRPSNEFPSEGTTFGIGGTFQPDSFIETRNDPNANTWDRRSLRHIEEHLQSERSVVEGYEAMRSEVDGTLAYLLDLVIADERRHHRLLGELANAIGGAMGRPEYDRTEIPQPKPIPAELRQRLLTETRTFIDVEREDAKGLGELQRDLKPARTTTIWPLIVELMALDTEKHLKVLRRIEQLLAE